MNHRNRKCEGGKAPDAEFLHNLWVRSKAFSDHQKKVAEALASGKPRPRIPDSVRAQFIVTREGLNHSCPETFHKLVPREDKNGDVVRDKHGEVVFKKAKTRISRRGVCDAIKDMYDPNQYTGGLQPA